MTLCHEGYSEREISRKVNVSKTVGHNAITKCRDAEGFSDRGRSGRPRRTTPRGDSAMPRNAFSEELV